MKFSEVMKGMLVHYGLWPVEAQEIIDGMMQEEDSDAVVADTLRRESGGYPDPIVVRLWEHVRSAALDWIDENKPKHFAQYELDPSRMDDQETSTEPGGE